MQQRQFLGTAHKATEGPGAAPRDARLPPPETADRIPRNRGGRPIEHERRARLALHLVLHQRVGGGADEHDIGRRLLLELCRQMQGIASRDVGPLWLVRQRAHHHRPGVQPQAERDAVRLPAQRIRGAQTLAQLEGCEHRPAGVVFLRHGCPKHRQKARAGDLDDRAVVALHRLMGQRQ